MTDSEMLARLKRRLELTGNERDELLFDLLADANALMLAFMNRETMPAALHPAQCALAAALYNRLGMEGESRRSEGNVSMTVETLPADITAQLLPYRLAKAVSL